MKIDAHQHFWQFDPVRDAWIDEKSMSAIRRDFMPSDLSSILNRNGINGCVAVQADQSEKETTFLIGLAAKYDFIKGVVGWTDIKDNLLADRLDYFSQYKVLKGFRHILQGEKAEFMIDPNFIDGLRLLGKKGFTYDILVFPRHLKAVRLLIKELDRQALVIDHMAKPYIKKGLIKEWAKDIKAIARHKNVYCKLSGIVTEADWKNWKTSDFTPYLDVVFEAFGTERLMYGSDWPVCLLAAEYDIQLNVIKDYVSKYAQGSEAKVFGENAIRFYNL
jgi:L-fuconolactonase